MFVLSIPCTVIVILHFSASVILLSDVHTCGVCHQQFVDVLSFLHHKLERMYSFDI